MRIMTFAVAAALVATPALAKPMSPLQQETAVWQAFKDKNAKAFGATFGPNYVGLYEDGIASRAKELDNLKKAKIASYKIDNFASRMIDNGEDMLVTYTVDVKGTMGKDDISGKYQAASLWHRTGNKWLGVYHTEIKAK